MRIKVNERLQHVEDGLTLFTLRNRVKPDADVIVLNGAPMNADRVLAEGDEAVFIRRGEIPRPDELEALMVSRHSPGVHEKVQRACVGIAGLGGLGSAVAIALARIGVGRLILADFDVVEPSNLNRQQYFINQIGRFKTDALREILAGIQPYVRVETHTVRLTRENIPQIFAEADVVVEAFDTPDAKAMIAESFAARFPKRPLVMASGLAGYESSNTIVTRRLSKNIYVVGDMVRAACLGVGLMAPRVGVAAHHQANAVLRLLLGENANGDEES